MFAPHFQRRWPSQPTRPARSATADVRSGVAGGRVRPVGVARFALAATVAVLATAAVLPQTAAASFSGSAGKVAWIHDGVLQVDDPFDNAGPRTITTVPKAETPLNFFAPESAVSWSPDGTKLAFVKAVDNGVFPDKAAIHVADLSQATKPDGTPGPITWEQVSFPYAGRVESCHLCEDGEVTFDHAPAWTPGGDLAWVRAVYADDNAPHVGENGATVMVKPYEEGQSGAVAYIPHKPYGIVESMVWPTGSPEPAVIIASANGTQVMKAASKQTITSELGVSDVDASPDGSRLVIKAVTMSGSRAKVIRWSSGEVLYDYRLAISDTGVRYSPDGTRLIIGGCADDRGFNQHCGWKTHTIPDPDGDIRPTDEEEQPYLDGNPAWMIGHTSANGGRSTSDIQSQDLPVIFAPGFLGSEIVCGGEKVWMPGVPPIHLEKIALAADGKSEAACPAAGGGPGAMPTGKEVDKFLGADVYGHATDWLRELKKKSKGHETGYYNMGWDWRKSPQENLTRVDEQITRLLAEDMPRKQGASRVAVATHSYGSLLMRTYMDDEARAKRVARIVTVGAPWWGAPKPVFPIAFGIEGPDFSALDLFIKNENLRKFIINSGGAYHLAPSDNYGPWLTYDGVKQDQGGVSRFLGSTGGNEALFAQARATHGKIDGFKDWNGKVDFRSVTGIGLPTVEKVSVAPSFDGETSIGLFFGQGDGTVPVRSATQGDMGTLSPLGDPVHIQYRCGVPHMRQTADEFTQRAYADFLLTGAIPRRMPHTNCPISGQLVKVFRNVEIGQPTPRALGRAVPTAGGRSLADAELADEVDVIRLPGQTVIVTSDGLGGPLGFDAQGDKFTVSPITDAGEGTPRTYGPVTGRVVLGGTAADPQVTVDGQPVAPVSTSGSGGNGNGGTGGNGSAGGGGSNGGGGQPGATDRIAAQLKVGKTLRPDRKGRVTVNVSAETAATGTATLVGQDGKALAKAVKVKLKKAGRITVSFTLNRATRARLRRGKIAATVSVTLDGAGSATSRATGRTTVRGR